MSAVLRVLVAAVFIVTGLMAVAGSDHIHKDDNPENPVGLLPLPVLGGLSVAVGILLLISVAFPPADHLVTTLRHAYDTSSSIYQRIGGWVVLPFLALVAVAGLVGGVVGVVEEGLGGLVVLVIYEVIVIGLFLYDAAFLHIV